MLELRGITKTFERDGDAPVIALDNIHVQVNVGEFCIVIGNNGCGKSTLLNVVDGTVRPDQGQIYWDNKLIDNLPFSERQRLVAKVHQNPSDGAARTLTVAENLALAMLSPGRAGFRKLLRKDREERIREVLFDLDIGLNGRENAIVQNLSGGQRQALSVYMAVISEPKILLLDEHTAALDPDKAEKIMDLTVRLWAERQLTVLMVTHNLNEAIQYGNRLLCMSQGRIYMDINRDRKKDLSVPALLDIFKSKKESGLVVDSSFML